LKLAWAIHVHSMGANRDKPLRTLLGPVRQLHERCHLLPCHLEPLSRGLGSCIPTIPSTTPLALLSFQPYRGCSVLGAGTCRSEAEHCGLRGLSNQCTRESDTLDTRTVAATMQQTAQHPFNANFCVYRARRNKTGNSFSVSRNDPRGIRRISLHSASAPILNLEQISKLAQSFPPK
jgi:hypothetical protein